MAPCDQWFPSNMGRRSGPERKLAAVRQQGKCFLPARGNRHSASWELRRFFFSPPIYHASGQEVRPTAGDSGNAARFAWKMKPVRPQPPSPQPPPSKGVCRQVCHGHPPRRFARHVATRDIFHPDAVSPPWSSRLGIWKDENPRVMDTVSPRSRDCETGCVPSDGPGWC